MRVRQFLPDALRIAGRAYVRAACRDFADMIASRPRPALVPPARFDTNGVGDYISVGDAWSRRFYENGLSAEHDVLEIGCGTGRIARALVGSLRGDYLGFDVLRSAVTWASKAFAPHANFTFEHLNIFNDLYNPKGKPIGPDFTLSSPPRDFAYATSLFSHLDHDVSTIYLREIFRVLRPGGTLVSTWYLYTPDTLRKHGLRYDLPHEFGFFRRQSLVNPALVVAYDQSWLIRTMRETGFSSVEIREGGWRGGSYAGQDVVIATK